MSDTSVLLGLLAAIEKQNKARYKTSAPHLFTGGKGPAPSVPSKGVVNPKTSKGSETDGGGHHRLGVLGALGSDIEDTIRGIPGGVVQTIHDPVGTVKAIGADYKRRYSPLLTGDFGKFAKESEAHPLAPLLDVASVLTGGGALAAKVGQGAHVAEEVNAAKATDAARVAERAAADSAPAHKAIKALTTKKAKVEIDRSAAEARVNNVKAPADVQASSARSLRLHENTIKAIQDEIDSQSKSLEKISAAAAKRAGNPELSAPIQALVKLQKITKGDYRRIAANKGSENKFIEVAQPNNPVKRLRQNLGINMQENVIPARTPLIGLESRAKKAANLQRDVTAGRIRYAQTRVKDADAAMQKVAGKNTALHSSMAVAAQGLIDGVAPKDYARLVKDTRSHGDEIQHSIRQGQTQEEHHAFTDTLTKPHTEARANELYQAAKQYMQRESIQAGRVINPIHLQRVESKLINSPEVKAIVDLQKAHEAAATDAMEQLVKNRMLKPDAASQQAVLHVNLVRAAKGQAPRDFEATRAAYEKAGLPPPSYNPDLLTFGEGSQRAGMVRESKGTLYSRGTRTNSPMNIVMRHELASKATDIGLAHKLMLSAARKVAPGEKLPKGYVWVKDTLTQDINQKNALFRNMVEDGKALPDAESYYKLLEAEKRPNGGYAIRKDVAEDLIAGRKAMTAARAETLAKGITAWKFLVLTRPAFLVHNVLSNTAMYHLKNGWNFAAFRNMKTAFESGAFKEHHSAEGLTFSEDAVGTSGKSKISKAVRIFYKLTAQHEHWLRQLTAYETARKMPEFQRELRALKGGKYNPAEHGGRTMFHEAYNRAVAKNPHVRDLVTRNMDDTLGNYRYYTAQERQLKNISPFYGWERHSVRNMVRMMEDNPATMAMLTQIGIVGHKKFNKDFGPGMPDFVKSYVQDSYIQTLAQHLGLGDQVSMYDFNSTNPWTTAIDVGKAASGDKNALVSNLGPLVTGPIEAITGKSALTGAPSNSRFDKYGPILGGLDRVITQTPPVSAWDALTSKKNESKKMLPASDKQVIAQQSGFDFRNLNKDIARKMEKQNNGVKDKYGNLVKKKKKANPFYN